jgi:hypothetical protein
MLLAAEIAVGVLLASLAITTTRQHLGPGRPWTDYVMPTLIAVAAMAVLVLILGR